MLPQDAVFFLEFSDTAGYTFEDVRWYSPERLPDLHPALCQFIRTQLNEAYAGHSEWLNLAEYPDIEEQLESAEVEVFRSAGGIEGDEFHGLRAVVLHRLENTTVEGMQSAIELFQWVLDCGLFFCDESDHPPKCLAMVGDITQFAPFLLDRIRNRVCPKRKISDVGPDAYEVAFRPLLPAIEELRRDVERPEWRDNGLALTLFSCIYALYEQVVQEQY